MSRNSSTHFNQLSRCTDGHDCHLQYDESDEHNARYSHPCRWSELCKNMSRSSEHAHKFTHDTHHASPCKYGSEECTKVTDPEHRRAYRHEGLPDFLQPCKHKDLCSNRSTEHLKEYQHPSSSYKKTQSK